MQDLIWLTERWAAYFLVNRFTDDSLQRQYQSETSLAHCSIAVLHSRGCDLLNLLRSHLQKMSSSDIDLSACTPLTGAEDLQTDLK